MPVAGKFRLRNIVAENFKCAPFASTFNLLAKIYRGLSSILTALTTAYFIDTAMAVLSGQAAYGEIWLPLGLVALVVAVGWFVGDLDKLASERRKLKLVDKFRVEIVEKCARLEYSHIENPETWDLINRVTTKSNTEFYEGYTTMLDGVSMAISVVSIMGLLIAHVWWAALAIVVLITPLLVMARKSGQENYQAHRDSERNQRRSEYLSEVLIDRESADERALFGFSGKLAQKYIGEYLAAYRVRFKAERKWFIKLKAGSVLYSVISIIVSLMLIGPAISGSITIGTFMALVNATFGLVQTMSWTFTSTIDGITRRIEFLKDFNQFNGLSELEGALDDPAEALPPFHSIEFRDVRFKYPGTDRYVLDGLSLKLEGGRHYAFVGVNGAGKTTLTKLLTGLYDQYEGEILINGRELRGYSQSGLKALYSLVYQDFARYSVPLRDTIAFKRPAREAALEAVIGQVGLSEAVAALPAGLDTPLGKILEEGSDLSGGQWQRVAIARALANPTPVRILDEPTAALDPISESDIYREFKAVSAGITTLFISHRLGSTLLADEIFVIGEGRVLESGDHSQLMSLGGLYAEMYEAQRSWYQ